MKTISFALQKGGTGKTSISVSVAAELSKRGKTILVDADPQGNATGWIFGDLQYELADVLLEQCNVAQAVQKTEIENLYILPTAGSGGSLRNYSETKASAKPLVFKQLARTLVSMDFEYCVIDTSPSFNALEKACFIASDEIIAVMQIDVFSSDGFSTFTESLGALRKDFELPANKPLFNKLVFNSHDARIQHQEEILKQFYRLENYQKFIVPVDQSFKKAQVSKATIDQISGTKKETINVIKEIARSL